MRPALLRLSIWVVASAGAYVLLSSAAWADDCSRYRAAMIAQAKLPHATTMTVYDHDDPPVRYEQVFTGTRVYYQDGGKWVMGSTTPQAAVQRVEDNFRMTVGLTCNLVGSEMLANEAASIFMVHMELGDLMTRERIWISDSTQLPLKTELASPSSKVVWTFRYQNIEPPEVAQ